MHIPLELPAVGLGFVIIGQIIAGAEFAIFMRRCGVVSFNKRRCCSTGRR
jgi:hypothetical protein